MVQPSFNVELFNIIFNRVPILNDYKAPVLCTYLNKQYYLLQTHQVSVVDKFPFTEHRTNTCPYLFIMYLVHKLDTHICGISSRQYLSALTEYGYCNKISLLETQLCAYGKTKWDYLWFAEEHCCSFIGIVWFFYINIAWAISNTILSMPINQ